MEGIVMQSNGLWYLVQLRTGETVKARLRGQFKIKGLNSTNPIAVGDKVVMDVIGEDYIINKIEDRFNFIIRRSPRNKHKAHIIAANIDQAVLVISHKKPRTSLGFIDRFLLNAAMYHIPVLLVFNKKDEEREKDIPIVEERILMYQSIGYKILHISALETDHITLLKKEIMGKVNLFAGHSGVGKSTIINQLFPDLQIATKEISNFSNKGQHTTTSVTMYELDKDTFYIDSPGIKEFENIDIEPTEVSHYFLDILPFISGCKYHDCTHINEPNCAVKEAVQHGEIDERRYISYTKLVTELLA